MIDVEELIEALENAGEDPKAYSGRAMFGSQCVSITIESESVLWDLAQELARNGIEIAAPRTDSMGRDIVAYWPSAKWPEDA